MGSLLEGKVCIVTGSARGIGQEIATLFAEEGGQVIVNDAEKVRQMVGSQRAR